jgi:hypothetical protein
MSARQVARHRHTGGIAQPRTGYRPMDLVTAPPAGGAPRDGWHSLAASLGLIGAVWLLAVSRWIVADKVVPWDSKNQFYAFCLQ